MKVEQIFSILEAEGYSPDTLKVLRSDEDPPDGFDVKALIQERQQTRQELFIHDHSDSIISKYEDENRDKRHMKAVMPFFNRIKKLGVFTEAEMDEKLVKENPGYVKDLFDKLPERINNKVKTQIEGGAQEWQQKYSELQKEYESLEEGYEGKISNLNEQLESKDRENAQKFYNFKIDLKVTDLLNNKEFVELADSKLFNVYKRVILDDMKRDGVIINPDNIEQITASDGTTKVKKKDGQGFYKNGGEYILDIMKANHFVKLSNGGEGGGGSTPDKIIVRGKEVDASASAEMSNFFK